MMPVAQAINHPIPLQPTNAGVRDGITSYLAAHTILEFLGHICDQPRWVARRNARTLQRVDGSVD
jgi:hypothetical protein